MDIKELKKEIPYRWRVQSFSKFKPQAQCVAYVDARDVMKLFDEVCGAENWQDKYYEVSGMLFCEIGVKVGDEWVFKGDTGSESNIEKEKGHSSDAFKRAAVKWGVGRFLYELDIKYLNASEKKTQSNFPYVVDSNNNRVYDITKLVNGSKDRPVTPKAPVKPTDPRKVEMVKLAKQLKSDIKDSEVVGFIIEKTGEVMKEENYDEIINKLKALAKGE